MNLLRKNERIDLFSRWRNVSRFLVRQIRLQDQVPTFDLIMPISAGLTCCVDIRVDTEGVTQHEFAYFLANS